MRIITLTRILILLLFLSNSHCAFFHASHHKEKNLKKEIVKGVTSETMVLNLLGMPVSVAPNHIGDEVWSYKHLSYTAEKINDTKILILWEITTGDSTSVSTPFDLMITFDQNDIVKDFELVLIPFDSSTK